MNVKSSQSIEIRGPGDFGSRVLPMINNILDSGDSSRHVMKIGSKHYTLSSSFVHKLNERYEPSISSGLNEMIKSGSNTNYSDEELWEYLEDEESGPKQMELIELSSGNYDFDLGAKRSYNKARGAFFAYTHSFEDEYIIKTLSRIGCFKSLNMSNYKDNCFIVALK
eukprot:5075891-Pleurochrysis_carterae.AAC.1